MLQRCEGSGHELVDFPSVPPKSLAALVTPTEAKTLPVHRWFLYPHSFSPGLVREVLAAIRLAPGTVVYDPFAGAGTTLRTAQEEGYPALGADMLPLSVLLSNVKVANYDLRELDRSWMALQGRLTRLKEPPEQISSDIPLVTKAFSAASAAALAHLRAAIIAEPVPRYRCFFLAALARLVERVSLAVKSGGWLRLVERNCDASEAVPSFVALVEAMMGDVKCVRTAQTTGPWRCWQGDATRMPRVRSFGAVITSPPYLNRHDYTRVLALEHAVLFNMGQAELVALRRGLVRSHVEARRLSPVHGYKAPKELVAILPALAQAAHTDRRVYPMITGYFEDMFLTLRALKSRLDDNGYVAFVLGDVRFAGIQVPVEIIVRRLGEQVGLRWLATWQARERGNSAQQMKVFGREPAGEYVIIWQAA